MDGGGQGQWGTCKAGSRAAAHAAGRLQGRAEVTQGPATCRQELPQPRHPARSRAQATAPGPAAGGAPSHSMVQQADPLTHNRPMWIFLWIGIRFAPRRRQAPSSASVPWAYLRKRSIEAGAW